MPQSSDVHPGQWSDSWIDETWPPESAGSATPDDRGSPKPVGGSPAPSAQYLLVAPAPDPRKALLLAGLTLACLLAAAAIVAAVTLPSDVAQPAPTAPTGPLVSVDQVFASIPGYSFEAPPPSAIAGLRAQLDGQPAAKAITTGVGGRRVVHKGQTVAVASAVLFQEQVGASQDAEAAFLAAAQSGLSTYQEFAVDGRRAVLGEEPDGIQVLVVYKNGVGLVVGGAADRSAVEELTAKLLANIP